jgi:hypothetical protein
MFFFIWHLSYQCKVTLSLSLLSPPYSFFQRKSKETLLNLNMKSWNSAFNAQGSRVIIVVLQVGAVVYVTAAATVQCRRAQEEKGKTGYHPKKIDGKN